MINEDMNSPQVNSWQEVYENEIIITKTGKYAIKVEDKDNNVTIKTINVVLNNAPNLAVGMVPVIYDEQIAKWKKVEDDELGYWYDYGEKKWANVMLKDDLVINEDGTIDNDKMGSMFVWVPSYMYKISESGYHTATSEQIEIKFLKGTTVLPTDNNSVTIKNATGYDNWNIHPAFTDGSKNNYENGGWDKELTGIWVSKFEASSKEGNSNTIEGDNVTTKTIKIIPNVSSWRYIDNSNAFMNCLNMKNNSAYGLIGADTHLMKNTEWGAIAYLSASIYGSESEISINNSSTYITGNSANSTNAESVAGIINEYNSTNGITASTTGNIYGIYDMSRRSMGKGQCFYR